MACSSPHHKTWLGAGAARHPAWHTFKTVHPASCRRAGLQQRTDPLLSEFAKWEFNSPALPPTAATQKLSSLELYSYVHLLQIPTHKVCIPKICTGTRCSTPTPISRNMGSEGLSHLPTSYGNGMCMHIQPWKALLLFPTYFQSLAENTGIEKKK